MPLCFNKGAAFKILTYSIFPAIFQGLRTFAAHKAVFCFLYELRTKYECTKGRQKE